MGGLTWTKSETIYARKINFSLADSNKVYASGFSYLYKSSDIGEHWTAISNDTVRFCAPDPYDANRILVPQLGDNPDAIPGLYQTLDDGTTWELIGFEEDYLDFISFGKTLGTIYVVKRSDTAIWKSSDNGATWSVLTDSFASDIIDFDVTGETTKELFVTVEDYGAAFESNIWRSTDGGTTWSNIPSRWAYYLYDKVAIDPSDSNRIIGYQNRCGMHFTWDAGSTWTHSGSMFPGIPLQHIGVSPVREGLLLVQTKNGYNLRSLDSGQTWEFTHFKNEKSGGFGFAFCMNNEQGVYWISGTKILQSLNGGLDWQDLTPADFTNPSSIAVHPANDLVLLCGSQNGVLIRSIDAGQNWTEVYNAQNTAVRIARIQFKPLDSSVMYAGTENWMTSEIKLLKSTDSGATWVEVSRLPSTYLRDLAVTRTEPEVIYASDGQRLLRSKDFGVNWDLPGAYRSIDSDRCLTSFHHGSWVWSLGYIVFWFSR